MAPQKLSQIFANVGLLLEEQEFESHNYTRISEMKISRIELAIFIENSELNN